MLHKQIQISNQYCMYKVESIRCNLQQRIYVFLRLHVQDLRLLSQGQTVPCGTQITQEVFSKQQLSIIYKKGRIIILFVVPILRSLLRSFVLIFQPLLRCQHLEERSRSTMNEQKRVKTTELKTSSSQKHIVASGAI